jgi:hypothetical protein
VFTLDNASPLPPGVGAMHRTGTKVLFDATLDPRMSAAERAGYAWIPGTPPAGRDIWSGALGVPMESFVFTLRDRADGRIAPLEASPRMLHPTRLEELSGAPGLPLHGVLVLGESLYLVRAFRSGEALAIAIDTPRLARVLAQRRRARLVLGATAGVVLAAAIGTLGADADYALAGSLAGAPLELAGVGGLPYPVDATAIIEGGIDIQGSGHIEGVPGVAGFAGMSLDTVRFTIDGCHGRRPEGDSPQDLTSAMAVANEILTARHLRSIEGGLDLRDVHCPVATGGLITILQLAPRVAGQAKTALLAALSGPSVLSRLAIAIDPDVSATDPAELLWAMASRVHAKIDIAIIERAGGLPSDPLARPVGHGAALCNKWIYDATIPLGRAAEENADEFARATPKNLANVRLEDFI